MGTGYRLWLYASGSLLCINLACNLIASDVYAWLFPTNDQRVELHFPALTVFALLLLAGVWVGRSTVAQLLTIETRPRQSQTARQRRVLIWFLSDLKSPAHVQKLDELSRSEFSINNTLQQFAQDKKTAAQSGSLAYWPWEQALRGIWHNVRPLPSGKTGPLEFCILVCSRESVQQAKRFQKMLACCCELKHIHVLVWLNHNQGELKSAEKLMDNTASIAGWDFEEFDQLFACLVRLNKILSAEPYQATEREIAIDLTGGSKPVTVAAAAVTISSSIVNQYVCTNPIDKTAATWEYQVLEYDLTAQTGWQ